MRTSFPNDLDWNLFPPLVFYFFRRIVEALALLLLSIVGWETAQVFRENNRICAHELYWFTNINFYRDNII